MFSLLIVVYVQFMIMLIELKKALSQELKCLCVCIRTTTVVSEFVPETVGASLLHFYCSRNKYNVQKFMYTV